MKAEAALREYADELDKIAAEFARQGLGASAGVLQFAAGMARDKAYDIEQKAK